MELLHEIQPCILMLLTLILWHLTCPEDQGSRDQLRCLYDHLTQDEMMEQKLVNLAYFQCFMIHYVLSDVLNVNIFASMYMQIVLLPYAKIKIIK